MVILDEVKRRLSELAPEVTDLHDALAIERSRVRLEELEQKSASPEFYDDAAASGAVFAEMGELKDRLEQYAALQTMLEDAETLLEMCAEDEQCHPDRPCGRGRHRGSGLGGDAGPHVHALCRTPQLDREGAGLSGGRRGGHQVRVHSGGGAQRLRFFALR